METGWIAFWMLVSYLAGVGTVAIGAVVWSRRPKPGEFDGKGLPQWPPPPTDAT